MTGSIGSRQAGTAATDWDDYREIVGSAAAGALADAEQIQDIVGALVVAGTGITATYDDASSPPTLTIAATTGLTTEQVQDIAGALIVAGSNITATYDDASSPATLTIAGSAGGLTQEQVEDVVGALLVAGAGATVTYDDASSPATITIAAAGGDFTEVWQFAVGDETTAITTGTAKWTFRAPKAITLTGVRASLSTVSSSGTPTVDINVNGSTVLSTKITIDASEKTSVTAATPAVISSSVIADDDEITIDIDVAGTGAAGLKVVLIGTASDSKEVIQVAISDETTAITTGTAKVTMRVARAMTITAVRANLNTVSSSGTPTVDINKNGSTILSTKLTIDASEKTSVTAATPAVISDTALASDDELTFDIDTAGTGAKGLKITIIGTP